MDYVIETQFGEVPFTMVPNYLLRNIKGYGLKPEDVTVLAFMASHPSDWILRRSVVMEAMGLGKDRWQAITKRLRECGALKLVKGRSACGRHIVTSYIVGWPPEREASASTQKRGAGKPASTLKRGAGKSGSQGGKSGRSRSENPAPYENNTAPDARAHKASAASGAAARPRGEVEKPRTLQEMWDTAETAVSMGLNWRHPETGEWKRASEWAKANA